VQDRLDNADQRDVQADARDLAAHRRDVAASMEEYPTTGTNSEAVKARGASAMDRLDSRVDKAAAKGDRTDLADDAPAD
jgi:hypothetical protein